MNKDTTAHPRLLGIGDFIADQPASTLGLLKEISTSEYNKVKVAIRRNGPYGGREELRNILEQLATALSSELDRRDRAAGVRR